MKNDKVIFVRNIKSTRYNLNRNGGIACDVFFTTAQMRELQAQYPHESRKGGKVIIFNEMPIFGNVAKIEFPEGERPIQGCAHHGTMKVDGKDVEYSAYGCGLTTLYQIKFKKHMFISVGTESAFGKFFKIGKRTVTPERHIFCEK